MRGKHLFTFFLLFIVFCFRMGVYGSIHWDKDKSTISTDLITIRFCSRRPYYMIWHNKEPNVKYFMEIRRLIEFIDENNNGVLDNKDTMVATANLESKIWEFRYDTTVVNQSSVTILTLEADIPVIYMQHGYGRRNVAVRILNYISEEDTYLYNESLRGLSEVRTLINIATWPWRHDESRIQMEVIFGIKHMTHKIRSIRECRGRYNIEIGGDSSSYMYLNISEKVLINDNLVDGAILVTNNSVGINVPHFRSNITVEMTMGVSLIEELAKFESVDYGVVGGILSVSVIILVGSIVYTKKKIGEALKIVES